MLGIVHKTEMSVKQGFNSTVPLIKVLPWSLTPWTIPNLLFLN